jgi:hypothetical protein
MKKQSTMSYDEIKKVWDKQPFLERLLFLMNEFNLEEDEASKLAKLQFSKINIFTR